MNVPPVKIKTILQDPTEFFLHRSDEIRSIPQNGSTAVIQCDPKQRIQYFPSSKKKRPEQIRNRKPFDGTSMVKLEQIRFVLRHLSHWVKTTFTRLPFLKCRASSFSFPEPYGSVLILSPWNYPFQLNLLPLVDALAAGNCAVLKPSEHAPHTAAVLAEIIRQRFPPKRRLGAVPGGQETNKRCWNSPLILFSLPAASEWARSSWKKPPSI